MFSNPKKKFFPFFNKLTIKLFRISSLKELVKEVMLHRGERSSNMKKSMRFADKYKKYNANIRVKSN